MLARARASAPKDLPVEFVLADATVYPFEPASFDLLASRFGVMFFAEPVLSFANMRRALRPSGRLAFACWREPRENPWMMAPLQAVYKHVPKLPPQGPEDPGPFAFASEERVHRILGEAGFPDIAMEAVRFLLDVAIGRGLDAAVQGVLEIGPAHRALEGQPPDVVAAATQLDPRGAGAIGQRSDGAAWRIDLDRDGEGFLRDAALAVSACPAYLCMGLFSKFWVRAAHLGPLLKDHRQMHDGLHGLFHVLHAHPFQPRMERVLAGEDVGAGQPHERQPRAVGAAADAVLTGVRPARRIASIALSMISG